jgi:hypothetical protein
MSNRWTAAAKVAQRHGRKGLGHDLGDQPRAEAVRRRFLWIDVDRKLRLRRGQVGLDVTQLGVLLELGHDKVRRLTERMLVLPAGAGFEAVGSGAERGGLELRIADAIEVVELLSQPAYHRARLALVFDQQQQARLVGLEAGGIAAVITAGDRHLDQLDARIGGRRRLEALELPAGLLRGRPSWKRYSTHQLLAAAEIEEVLGNQGRGNRADRQGKEQKRRQHHDRLGQP